MLEAGHEHEPELEEVGEEQEHVAFLRELEGRRTYQPEQEQPDRDVAREAGPAQRHDEEAAEVHLVEVLVEGLVVRDATQVDEVHERDRSLWSTSIATSAPAKAQRNTGREPSTRTMAMISISSVISGALYRLTAIEPGDASHGHEQMHVHLLWAHEFVAGVQWRDALNSP